ncbi:unnamed protein product [Discosporangium mesarthrocarpum]
MGLHRTYTTELLLHLLDVRDMIEAERFVSPQINERLYMASLAVPARRKTMNSLRVRAAAAGLGLGLGGGTRAGKEGRDTIRRTSSSQTPSGVGEAAGGGGREGGRGRGSSSLENFPPPALDLSMWGEADGRDFMVRGASYLTNRVKVPSARQMFGLRAVDMLVLPQPELHLAAHPANRVQRAREAGEKTFVWILQIMVPGPPHYGFICYFTPEKENWLDESTPFGKLASRVFFGEDDTFRDQRLKLIPKASKEGREGWGGIVEGNWIVKKAAGTTPAILGTKLKQHHFLGDNYLETDIEIGNVAASVVRLCAGYAKTLVVDMVWTIQGDTPEELPEVALGGVRIVHMDMLSAKTFDPAQEIPAEITSTTAAAKTTYATTPAAATTTTPPTTTTADNAGISAISKEKGSLSPGIGAAAAAAAADGSTRADQGMGAGGRRVIGPPGAEGSGGCDRDDRAVGGRGGWGEEEQSGLLGVRGQEGSFPLTGHGVAAGASSASLRRRSGKSGGEQSELGREFPGRVGGPLGRPADAVRSKTVS